MNEKPVDFFCHEISFFMVPKLSRDWKVSELESVRIGKCQNWKVSELESVRIGKCQNFLKFENSL